MRITDALGQLIGGQSLSEAQAEAVFEDLLAGRLDAAQIGALLALIQARGATVDELVGAARVMRRHAHAVQADPKGPPLIDTCGTGGAPKTFNISSAAAIVGAAAGKGRLRIAKHGNRSRTGRGSAEILQALGVNIEASNEAQARCLAEIGVCFCFAINHHPAAFHAAGPRRSLGVPTLFNLLGPLTNPAGARRQLLGVYAEKFVEPMARALLALGAEEAMVVHGLDGLDEITTRADTIVARVRGGEVRMERISAQSLGIDVPRDGELEAADLAASAAMIRGVIDGKPGAPADIVCLNAGAALAVASVASDIAQGLAMAREAVANGEARQTLERLVALSHSEARPGG